MTENEEMRANVAHLSRKGPQLIDFLFNCPDAHNALDWSQADVAPFVTRYPMQVWPTLVDKVRMDEIRGINTNVANLIKSVPERLFENKPEAIARALGFEEFTEMIAAVLQPPTGISDAICRGDFIETEQGFKYLELNVGPYLGGWELGFFENWYLQRPFLTEFCGQSGIQLKPYNMLQGMLHYMVSLCLGRGLGRQNKINMAVLVEHPEQARIMVPFMQDLYNTACRRVDENLSGTLVICGYDEMLTDGRKITYEGVPVDILFEYGELLVPGQFFTMYKEGRVALFNGPLDCILNDKRMFAFLSSNEDSLSFSAEERALITTHIPWTRLLQDVQTTFRGESVALVEATVRLREHLVLKKGLSSRGDGVIIGFMTNPEEWAAKVCMAVDQGSWIVQERLQSRVYPYQCGGSGYGPHDVVWGCVAFGQQYGGSFLRVAPRGRQGVLNAAQGAQLAYLYEV